MFVKTTLFLIFWVFVFVVKSEKETDDVIVEENNKLSQVSEHTLRRVQRKKIIPKDLGGHSLRQGFHDYEDYPDDTGNLQHHDNNDSPPAPPFFPNEDDIHPPAIPPFEPMGEQENSQSHSADNFGPPAPPDFGSDVAEKKPSHLESVPIREFCTPGQDHIQLGPCSATFVFIEGNFKKAIEVTECFDSEINRLNEATEKLAISVNFCDQGPGVYRSSQQSGGECSRQVILCDKHRDPLSISCASNQVIDSHTLQCVPAPDHCLFVPNRVYAPIREFLMEIYCAFKPVKMTASDPNSHPFMAATLGHSPLPVCDDWFVTCSNGPLEFGFCESGKIFDEARQLCREMRPEDQCSNIGACRGIEWQKVAFGPCRQEFGFCEGARPRIFTCQDQHVFHEGACVKPWQTNDQCGACKPGEKRRAPNCHQFYECSTNPQSSNIEWTVKTCPQNQYFEPANNSCTTSDGRCATVAECRDGDSYSPTCGDYILCINGKFMAGNCPHLTRWDGRQRRCVQDATCKRYLEMRCRHGDVIPSYDCETYQVCRKGTFVKEPCKNQDGKFFEPCRECEAKFQDCHGRYKERDYKLLTCVHGEKIIDTKDCRRYVECIQGEWYSMECKHGSFNPKTRTCTTTRSHRCGYERLDRPIVQFQSQQALYLPPDNQNILQDYRVNNAHSSQQYRNRSASYAQTDFLYESCTSDSTEYVAHPYDCSKYKKCDSKLGYYTEMRCHPNEQFDGTSGKCQKWYQCKAPSCVEGMRLPKEECGKAKLCKNGKWEDMRCKDGMAFINGRCSKTISCKTANPSPSYGQSNGRCFHGDTKPHQKYCSRFYLCSYGEFMEVECLNGQKYNTESKRCDPDYSCPSKYQPTCYHGETKPVEDKCDQYKACVDGEYQLKFCPYGEVFKQDQRRCEAGTCEYNNTGGIGHDFSSDPCHESPLPSGYRAHPSDCNRFYQCAHGKWVPKTCPANLAFNAALAVCDWPSNVPGC